MPVLPAEVVSRQSAEFELVCDIWSADAHIAREHARQAAVIAELARRRTTERDADLGSRGGPGADAQAMRPAALADVSDDFVSELALIRNCSECEASRLAAESILLTTTLAPTWSELYAGRLTVRKARHGHAYGAGGPTDCRNLCCLCRRHHRIKTFASGWSFVLLPDGRLVVRTPSGVSRTTRPPGWYHEPEPDPPWSEELAPPDLLRS